MTKLKYAHGETYAIESVFGPFEADIDIDVNADEFLEFLSIKGRIKRNDSGEITDAHITGCDIDEAAMATDIVKMYQIEIDAKSETLYRWKESTHTWEKFDEDNLIALINNTNNPNSFLRQILGKRNDDNFKIYNKFTANKVMSIAKQVKAIAQDNDSQTLDSVAYNGAFGTPKDNDDACFVQFKNGTLDIKNWRWHDHQWFPEKHIMNTINLDMNFEKEPNPENTQLIRNYTHELLKDPVMERFLYTWIGSIPIRRLAMSANGRRLDMLVLFYGRLGNEGKTTYASEIIEPMFKGNDNVSNLNYTQLLDQFNPQHLKAKILNIAPELNYTSDKQVGQLKALTGGDSVLGEIKHSTADNSFKSYASLLFVSNTLSRINDDTGAMKDRLVPIHFKTKFKGKDLRELTNKYPLDELTTKKSLADFLLYCMYCMHKQLSGEEDNFVMSEEMKSVRDAWFRQGAELVETFKDSFYLDENDEGGLPVDITYKLLKYIASEEIGVRASQRSTLETQLHAALPTLQEKGIRKYQCCGADVADLQPKEDRHMIWQHLHVDSKLLADFLRFEYSKKKNDDDVLNIIRKLPTNQLEDIHFPAGDDLRLWFQTEVEPYLQNTNDPEKSTWMHDQVLYTLYRQHYRNFNPQDHYENKIMANEVFTRRINKVMDNLGWLKKYDDDNPKSRHRFSRLSSIKFDWGSYDQDSARPFNYQNEDSLPFPFNSRCAGWYHLIHE